jgi:phosphinothricin acetyltransferase
VSEPRIRAASGTDAARIAEIYNAGVRERVATFETREHGAADFELLIAAKPLFLVAEVDGEVAGAVWVSEYDPVNS